MNQERICHYHKYCGVLCDFGLPHIPDNPDAEWFCEAEQRECHYRAPTIKIELAPAQIEQLRPFGEELYDHWNETGEKQMFVGQVITIFEGKFKSVEFGLIPPNQSAAIQQLRGLEP